MSTNQQSSTATSKGRLSRQNDRSTASRILDFGAANSIIVFHMSVIMTGMIIICFTRAQHLAVTLLWALACLATGGLIGFLFGIPRVLQQQPALLQAPVSTPTSTSSPTAGNPARDGSGSAVLGVNTNLEQISDWLTKIIVGIGLVELRNFPSYIKSITEYVAAGIGSAPESKTLVVASLVYFTVMGFMDSYLITRTYLSKIIKDFDNNTISSNDIEVLVGGTPLPLTEVSRQMRENVNELREQIVKMKPNLHLQESTTAAGPGFPTKTILWVDDEPDQNSLAIEELNRLNIKIDTAKTTSDAMTLISKKSYDLIISDMLRDEGGTANPSAGLELMEAVRKLAPTLPFVIMSDPDNVAKYKSMQQSTAKLVVTSSQTELIAALHNFFQEPQSATASLPTPTGNPEAQPPRQAPKR